MRRRRVCAATLFTLLILGCTTRAHREPGAPGEEPVAGATGNDRSAPQHVRAEDGFLAPNAEDVDGTPAYIHYTREDMPIRVNVELPRLAARYASRDETDAGVVHAIRAWETAIQPALPWFRLEIVRDDPKADISVEWKTRIVGEASGWGGIGWEMIDGRLRAKGHLQYATKPCLEVSCQLDLPHLELLVAHEFGHTLGLGHCLDCDSAMNYSWETLERTVVTATDVQTISALYQIPNGTRVDGKLLIPMREVDGRREPRE